MQGVNPFLDLEADADDGQFDDEEEDEEGIVQSVVERIHGRQIEVWRAQIFLMMKNSLGTADQSTARCDRRSTTTTNSGTTS